MGIFLTQSESDDVPTLYDRGRSGLTAAIVRRLRRLPEVAAERTQRLRAQLAHRMSEQ